MSVISFKTKILKVNNWFVVRLPKEASAKLTSRGLVMVKGTINGFPFKSPLEPDGKGGHWLKVTKDMQPAVGNSQGDIVTLAIEPSSEWVEPEVSSDIKKAINSDTVIGKSCRYLVV